MEYISAKEAAKLWGIDVSRIGKYAREGRIEGAKIVGRNWLIPQNAEKPIDGRTKLAKKMAESDCFRFPLFVNCDENKFYPPLNDEELLLKKAQHDFYACNFDSAQSMFIKLLNNAESIYIRIMSLFYLCSLSVEVYCGANFKTYLGRLYLELSNEFPHKKDMEIVIPWLYTIMVQFYSVSENLAVEYQYEYSNTVRPLFFTLSLYHLAAVDPESITNIRLDVYELLCHELIENRHYYEACELHFLLFLAYYFSSEKEAIIFHLRKGLELVKEHKLYIIAASYESYYQNVFDIVFKEFPEDFVNTIKRYSKTISTSIGIFTKKSNITDIYKNLSKSDFQYLLYALKKMTNKEVADVMHVSERTVAKRYNDIYDKLGVNSKLELVAKMSVAFGKK